MHNNAPPAQHATDQTAPRRSWGDRLWDAWCVASLVGIWPRFIEPRLLMTNMVTLKIKDLPEALKGLRVLHFSDLHFHEGVPEAFLDKLCARAAAFRPDIVAFTGDFLCLSRLAEKERLTAFLQRFPKGKYGNFAVLGNHDYEQFVTIDKQGRYDVNHSDDAVIAKGFKLLLRRQRPPNSMSLRVKEVALHHQLLDVLKQTPFTLLHNSTKQLRINGQTLNICGMGEYTLGRCLVDKAYQGYDSEAPGIILTHNPDSIPLLEDKPGTIILAGHTHGGQINLPYLRNKFLLMENPRFKVGMIRLHDKWAYITRGVGSVIPFRWFSPPELLCLTLTPA